MANHLFRSVLSQLQQHFLQSSAATFSSTSRLQKSASSSSSSFTVQFLVKECSLPLESALSVSKKIQLDEGKPQNPQSVLQFLRSHNFSDNQVAEVIVKYPQILRHKVENNLRPKFDYFVERGFTGKLFQQLIVSNPRAIRRSLNFQIKPRIEFLGSYLHNNEEILTAVLRSPRLFDVNLNRKLRSNVDFLLKEGVPSHVIRKIILLARVIQQNPKTFACAMNAVKKMGFEPNAPLFPHALRVMLFNPESTLKKKFGFMKSIGWNEQEIFKAFQRFPYFLAYSEAKIRNALNFYLNTMMLEHKNVAANPVLLGLSIEKRVRPRYNVLKVLESKNLIGISNKSLCISEKDFFLRYVDQYISEVPGLLEMYLGSKEAKKIDT